jgi:hypothetical protein
MLLSPSADLRQRRQEGAAGVCELVGHGEGGSLRHGAPDKPGVRQLAEPLAVDDYLSVFFEPSSSSSSCRA